MLKRLVFTALISFLISSVIEAQSIPIDTLGSNSELFITSNEFDTWVSNQFLELKRGKEIDSGILKTRTFNRLKVEKFVSNETILKTVKIVSVVEYNKFKENIKYPQTLDFIDSLISLTPKRADLRIKLIENKASLLKNSNASTSALEEIDNSIELYSGLSTLTDSANLELGLLSMQSHLQLAKLLFYNKEDKEGAKKHLKTVLRYPFFYITDEYYSKEMRATYIKAGTMLIQINRGDLNELNYLYFDVFTTPSLYPLLKQYIEEVGGTWDRDIPDSVLKFRKD